MNNSNNILIVGCGAREHALARAVLASPSFRASGGKLYAAGEYQNPGVASCCSSGRVEILDITDPVQTAVFAERMHIDLALIGPEAPLAAGVSDYLQDAGISVFGPRKQLAAIETSKSYARNLLASAAPEAIPQYYTVSRQDEAEKIISELIRLKDGCVIKADGLKGGKGVKVWGDHLHTVEDALRYSRELMETDGSCLIEEKLTGQEFSLLSFTDGVHCIHMPPVQDHKRAWDGDTGPNTGGMGSYTGADHSLPFLEPQDIAEAQRLNEKTAAALLQETGMPYRGVLYGGFMACREGIKVIEYNARFGDPEVLNLLPLLESDFLEICSAAADGKLDTVKQRGIRFAHKASVCKYVVPEGYPDAPVRGEPIDIARIHESSSLYLHLGSVAETSGKNSPDQHGEADQHGQNDFSELLLMGSRAAAVTALGDSIEAAELAAEEAASSIGGKVFHRCDIGTGALIEKRIRQMKELRSREGQVNG